MNERRMFLTQQEASQMGTTEIDYSKVVKGIWVPIAPTENGSQLIDLDCKYGTSWASTTPSVVSEKFYYKEVSDYGNIAQAYSYVGGSSSSKYMLRIYSGDGYCRVYAQPNSIEGYTFPFGFSSGNTGAHNTYYHTLSSYFKLDQEVFYVYVNLDGCYFNRNLGDTNYKYNLTIRFATSSSPTYPMYIEYVDE